VQEVWPIPLIRAVVKLRPRRPRGLDSDWRKRLVPGRL